MKMTRIVVRAYRPTSTITIKLLSEKLPKIDHTYFNTLPKKAKRQPFAYWYSYQQLLLFCGMVATSAQDRKFVHYQTSDTNILLNPVNSLGSRCDSLLNGVVLHALSSPHTVPHNSTFVPFAWSITFSHATWVESFTIYVTFHDTGRIPRTNVRRCCCCSAFTMETFLDL